MRFMMLMVPAGGDEPLAETANAGAMARYGDSLRRAGVLLATDGLCPPPAGTRVSISAGKARVTDGAPADPVLGRYWMIQARSKEEAVEWARRCPARDAIIEVLQVAE